MNKRIIEKLKEVIRRYARKVVLPIGIAVMCIAPNCVYAYDMEVNEWKNVQIYGGGMITGVVISEAEPNLAYVRTDMGGVYRWEESIKGWKPITDFVGPDMWSNLGCEGIATDPTDPNRVYTLMGEYTNSWTDINGAVFCSDDKGDSWFVSELPFKCGSNFAGRLIGDRLVVDPNKPSRLWLTSRENGLWKSEDYGHTWNEVKTFPTKGGFAFDEGKDWGGVLGLTWIEVDETSGDGENGSQIVYVGVAGSKEAIYRTLDGGKTWEALPNQPQGVVLNQQTMQTTDDILIPYQSYLTRDGMLYITYSTEPGPYDGGKGDAWKFNTKTDEWTLMSPVDGNDAWYGYHGITVDPNNEDHIVMICQSWWPDALMYTSTDGGETWRPNWERNGWPDRNLFYDQDISASPWLDWGNTHGVNSNSETSPKFGWTVGSLAIDPFNPDRLFYGTGATLYEATGITDWQNGGKFKVQVGAKGIEETVTRALVCVPGEGDGLISAMYDVNGFYHEDVTKVPSIVANVTPGDPFSSLNSCLDVDYAELNPNVVVRVGKRMTVDNYGSALNGMMWSKDGGKTFSPVHSRIGNSEGEGTVAVSADGKRVVWATLDEPVSYSEGGYNWTASKGVPKAAQVASDRVNPNVFYAYADGKVYTSMDGAETFTESETKFSVDGGVNIKAVRGHEGDVWLGVAKGSSDSGFWYSSDYGKTFTKLSDINIVTSFGFGKGKEGSDYEAIYIAGKIEGQNGFFRSDDKGQTWTRVNDNQHQYGLDDPGCDLTVDPDVYGRVYIGTNGRGIVYADTGNSMPIITNDITPTVAIFDKKEELQEDITIKISANENKLQAIKNGSVILIEGTDYTLSNDTVVISKTYLNTLEVGSAKIVFDFDKGTDPTLTLTIKDSIDNASIITTMTTFDKKEELQENVTVDFDANGNTLIDIKNGNATLVRDQDYTVTGNQVIVNKAYLATLAVGKTILSFDFDKGIDPQFTIDIIETGSDVEIEDSIVTPKNIKFDKGESAQGDIRLAVDFKGNSLVGIKNGQTVLKENKDYIVDDDSIILLTDYLKSLEVGQSTLSLEFNQGATSNIELEVVDSGVIVEPAGEITVKLASNGSAVTNTISSVFKVSVTDDSVYDLSKLTIRYYFTVEEEGVSQDSWVDHGAIGYNRDPWYMSLNGSVNSKIERLSVATDTATHFLEVSFKESVELDATAQLEIATRVANTNWSNFNQENDFSYNNSSNVAIFYEGQLVTGNIPQ